MISRKTTHSLGKVFSEIFKQPKITTYISTFTTYIVNTTKLYDFLFDHEYSAWFCNKASQIKSYTHTRPMKEFIMKIHTSETLYQVTKDWTLDEARKLGQRYLSDLTEDILNFWYSDCDDYTKNNSKSAIIELENRLNLDGYFFKNSRLFYSEEDVLDIKEQIGVLESLISSLHLENKKTTLHHLKLSEEHYLASRWDDSISNSRKFLESILKEVATIHSSECKKIKISQSIYGTQWKIRDYLENENILDKKEKETIAKVYSLLSETGGHPYMAQNDQARLLRHLALTFAQFVMLRLQGSIANMN